MPCEGQCRVRANADESEQQVSLEIVEGELTVSGDVSGKYDTNPVVPVTSLNLKLSDGEESNATVSIDLAMRSLLSGLLTEFVVGSPQAKQSDINSLALRTIVDKASVGEFHAKFKESYGLSLSDHIQGLVGADSSILFKNLDLENAEETGIKVSPTEVLASLNFQKGTSIALEQASLIADSVTLNVSGLASFNKGLVSLDFPDGESKLEIGNSVLTVQDREESWQANLESFTLNAGQGTRVSFDPEKPKANFDFSLSGAGLLAKLCGGSEYDFCKGLRGNIADGSWVKLHNVACRFLSEENQIPADEDQAKSFVRGDAEVKLVFAKGTAFSFDKLLFKTNSLIAAMFGKFEVDEHRLRFDADKGRSSISVGNSNAALTSSKDTKASLSLEKFTANVDQGAYAKLWGDEGTFDYRLTATANLGSSTLSEKSKSSSFSAVAKNVSFSDLVITAMSAKESEAEDQYLVKPNSPIVAKEIVIEHQARNGKFKISVPEFIVRSDRVSEFAPSKIQFDLGALVSKASSFEFINGTNSSLSASLGTNTKGKNPVIKVVGGKVELGKSNKMGFDSFKVDSPVSELKFVQGSQSSSLRNADINITAKFDKVISLNGGLNGNLNIRHDDFNLKGATLAVSTPNIVLDKHGRIQSGTALATLKIPERTLQALVKSHLNLPIKFDEKFKIASVETGVKGKVFFKAGNGFNVSFAGNKIKVSGRPSVDGRTQGKLPKALRPPVRATADFSATVVPSFVPIKNSSSIQELKLRLAITYDQLDFENVPDAIDKGLLKVLRNKFPASIDLPLFDDQKLRDDPWIKRLSSPKASYSEKDDIVTITVSASINKN